MRRQSILILVIGAITCLTSPVLASVTVYSFGTTDGTEWSNYTISTTPIGNRDFLGQFDSETVTLTLNNLPSHTAVSLSFDLFIIQTWDGQGPEGDPSGPDIWSISADNTDLNFITTFSNNYPGVSSIYPEGKYQKYPNQYPDGADVPWFTGASETNTLGYYKPGTYNQMDSVYHLSYDFVHIDDSLVVHFTGDLTNQIGDESWGLDNITVELQTIPAPSALILCSIGMGALNWFRRRKAI